MLSAVAFALLGDAMLQSYSIPFCAAETSSLPLLLLSLYEVLVLFRVFLVENAGERRPLVRRFV